EAEEGEHAPTIDLKQFVGRDAEIRRLLRLLESSVGGAPQLVSIAGEAGVGKSTLARRLTTEAALRGGFLVAGHCNEADSRAPYAPWGEVISALHRMGVGAKAWRELPHLVPAMNAGTPAVSGNKYAMFDEI